MVSPSRFTWRDLRHAIRLSCEIHAGVVTIDCFGEGDDDLGPTDGAAILFHRQQANLLIAPGFLLSIVG